jgi:hypothetical protein
MSVEGRIPSGELTTTLRAQARAAGIPSLDEFDLPELLNTFNGRWVAGDSTDAFAQASFLVEEGGQFGDGVGHASVALVAAVWTGTGAGRLIQLVGAFADWDWYDGSYITLDSSAPGTGWTAGERYLIAGKNSDDEIEIENLTSIDNGIALPAGANADTKATLSVTPFAAIAIPIPAPVGSSASNPERTFPAVDSPVPPQSSFWNYETASLPAGALTNGAMVSILFEGRIKITNVAARPSDAVVVYLIVDPMGSALIQDNRRNSGAVSRVSPSRIGWNPGSFSEESVPYTAATLSDLGGTLLVTLPLHSLISGDPVHLCSVPIDEDGNLGVIDDIEEGRLYYVCLDDIDAGIVDPDNSFTLSKVPPTDKYVPVGFSAATGKVCVSRGAFGSYRRIPFAFLFTDAEETANDDWQYCTGRIDGFADGTTANNEQGVIWRGQLSVHRTAEIAIHGANDVKNAIAMGTPDLNATAVIPRTTPGNTMNISGSGTESIVGAPLFRIKTRVYTDGGATDHHAYANTRMDFGGEWDVVEIDQKLHNEAYYTGAQIVVDAGAYNAANRTIQQAGKFTTYQFVNYDKIRLTGGTGIVAGYYELQAKEANNRVKLKADARLPLSDNANTTADIDEYPLVSFLGEQSTGQAHQLATLTLAYRASSGLFLGEVYFHDNLRQQIWIRRANDGEYTIPGETLTLKTYRREKEGGSGSWGFHDTTPIREYTVVAGRVNRGPQKIPLHFRVAVNGPPNGDCALEVRSGRVELRRHRSR